VTYRTFLICCAALESNRYLLVRIAVYRIFSFHADEKLQDYRTICSAFLNLRYFAGRLCHINVRVIVSPMNVCQSKAITAGYTVHFLAVVVFHLYIHFLKSTLNHIHAHSICITSEYYILTDGTEGIRRLLLPLNPSCLLHCLLS